MSNVKDSALPVATTMDDSDKLRALVGGSSKMLALSTLKTLLAYQPFSGVLSTLAGATPTAVGLNLLSALLPDATVYARISHLGGMTYLTPEQVVADIVANGGGVDKTTAQSLTNKVISGLSFAVGTASTPDASAVIIDTPSDSYLLRLIKVGYTGGVINFRFTGSTDVVFPKSGLLATVAKVNPVSDDTKAAAATLNLDTSDGSQVDVTGTTGITAITLAENVAKIVRFTGITTLTHSVNLLLPGAINRTTGAGDYAIFKGESGGVVRCIEYRRANGALVSDIDGSTLTNCTFTSSIIDGDVSVIRDQVRIQSLATGFNLRIIGLEVNTNDRALNISVNDADRQLNLAGDLNVTGNVKLYSGAGTPEAAVTATVGALYLRTDGSTSTTLYVKTSGSGNTGWTAK